MTAVDVLGERWTLRETWLWVRFGSVNEVVRYSGPLRNSEPQAVGVLSYEDAVTEVAVALRSGQLMAEGVYNFVGEREPIPRDVWSYAEWGRELEYVKVGQGAWAEVKIPASQILMLWRESGPPAPPPKPGRKAELFPQEELRQELIEGIQAGRYSRRHSASAIARTLQGAGRFKIFQPRTVAAYVGGMLAECHEIAARTSKRTRGSAENG